MGLVMTRAMEHCDDKGMEHCETSVMDNSDER